MFCTEMTFAVMNPDFQGAYLAICDDDIRTAKLFDTKHEMYDWIRDQIENQGVSQVTTTVLGKNGEVDDRLVCDSVRYFADENCYKGGMYEPIFGDNIRQVHSYKDKFSWI